MPCLYLCSFRESQNILSIIFVAKYLVLMNDVLFPYEKFHDVYVF